MKFRLALLLAGALTALPAGAADFPVRTVRMVVPFAAGGSTDLLARNIAQRLNEAWKQPVIVDNRAGGGGIVGSERGHEVAARRLHAARRHGHHACRVGEPLPRSCRSIRSAISRPITEIASIPQMLSVHPSIPARSVKELVALAKADPAS